MTGNSTVHLLSQIASILYWRRFKMFADPASGRNIRRAGRGAGRAASAGPGAAQRPPGVPARPILCCCCYC